MDYSYHCQYSTKLLEKLKSLDTKQVLDFDLINEAIYWAKKYHGDQKRKSGEAYYTHPLEVAYMISDYKLKTDVIVASILHDIVEDTEVTAGMILDGFGWRISEMVDRLTRDRPDGSKLSVEQVLNNAYQLKDEEVLMIKMIDRIHNLETAQFLSEEKKTKIKKFTLIDFLTLALDIEYYKFFDMMLSLCIEKEHPIFQDILSLRSIELNQSLYKFKDLPYYDF
ncbi:MAG: bifunctional (p)ppGpp synthetase/guanosine-3',5'-bis(diphosphate) 3'-pyrophosphohydrolase [Alphaproteobacteria bacterium]|nr:bifunctional (p)ppGpp synthetase/guanosine-3',5'-bis(diphosphate) 3'-pyrophosphohydrolase [Alphaproteobacteria bacterium]